MLARSFGLFKPLAPLVRLAAPSIAPKPLLGMPALRSFSFGGAVRSGGAGQSLFSVRLGLGRVARRPMSGYNETKVFEELAKMPFKVAKQGLQNLRRLGVHHSPKARVSNRFRRALMQNNEEVYLRRSLVKNTRSRSSLKNRGFTYKRIVRKGSRQHDPRAIGAGGAKRSMSGRAGGGGGRGGLISAVLGGLALLAGKTKYLIAGLKFAKMGTLLSMMLSTAAYAWLFGWPFAVGMVGLIFIHELGHAAAAMALGLPVTSMIFVPFMGAAVVMRGLETLAASKQVIVAIAGPVVGGLAALGVAMLGASQDSAFLKALAEWGFMVNLFNLMPVSGLDGGYILGACSRWFLLGGTGLMGFAIYQGYIGNPLMVLILLASGYNTAQHFFPQTLGRPFSSPVPMTPVQKAITGVAYLAVVFALSAAQDINKASLPKPPTPPQYKEYGVEEYV